MPEIVAIRGDKQQNGLVMTSAQKLHTIAGIFQTMQGTLTSPVIAYETWGTLNAAKDNAVLIFTGLSPSAHAASSGLDPSDGWWEEMIGTKRPIDTDQFFVICINSLGSWFGSTGPASISPRTGETYRLDFPVLHVEDIAKAGFEVVKSLGISTLNTVVGPSMGGMTALAFTLLFPHASNGLLSISSAASALPMAIALRSLQREIIRKDRMWKQGQYEPGEGPIEGLRLARKLGTMTYRSAEEFAQRFRRDRVAQDRTTEEPFAIAFEVESYLEAQANKFIFDANCYLYLSRAMDLFDVSDYGGSLEAGLAKVGASKVLVIGVETDALFPLKQQRELAQGLDRQGRNVEFVTLPSIQGHDSFLVDMDRFRPVIARFFRSD